MEVFYHGSSALFSKFALSHALEGAGRVKYGYGVYVTSHYSSAAHYAGSHPEAKVFFVYTVEVPEQKADNYIAFNEAVNADIIQRATEKLGEAIPEKFTRDGKDFRKYLARKLTGKRLTGKVDLEGEKAAAAFLLSIGVEFIVWPRCWNYPESGINRAVLDESKVEIRHIDWVDLNRNKQLVDGSQRRIRFYSISPFIQQYYPKYYSIERYPADQCVTIRKITEEWGVLGNFAHTPLTVHGVTLNTSEQLFQLMKFVDEEPVLAVYQARNPKFRAKHLEKENRRRDWGSIIVDAMKFCLSTKFEQSEEFRDTLLRTTGSYIVEDQTTFSKKTADTWGTKRVDDEYVGPNLLGRLLMELRDNKGKLDYQLPEDMFQFASFLTHTA